MRRSLKTWLRTTWSVLRHPTAFYAGLELRTPDGPARTFSGLQYFGIGIAAAAFALGNLASVAFIPRSVIFVVSAFAGLGIPLLGWLTHRTLAAIAVSRWLAQQALPDFAWAAKVICYETVFLWVPSLFLGAMLTSVKLFGAWISSLLRALSPTGRFVDLEPTTALIGLGVIGLFWLVRLQSILRRIRWSNY